MAIFLCREYCLINSVFVSNLDIKQNGIIPAGVIPFPLFNNRDY